MKRGVSKRKPTFLWQAVLIVLPVILLAAVGFLSLRQDKLLASSEARERAQTIADDLLPKFQKGLSDTNSGECFMFQVSQDGMLVIPPPAESLPQPTPLPLGELSPKQVKLWNELQSALFREHGSNTVEACRAFLNTTPPRQFAAIATYDLGVALSEKRDLHDALAAFTAVRSEYPNAVTESGLPVDVLAEYGVLDCTGLGIGFLRATETPSRRGRSSALRGENVLSSAMIRDIAHTNTALLPDPFVTVESFCSNLVSTPSPLSEFFLDTLEKKIDQPYSIPETAHLFASDEKAVLIQQIASAKARWAKDQQSRSLYKAARRHAALKTPKIFWFANDGTEWLVNGDRNGTNTLFVCRPKQSVQDQINSAAAVTRWPEYMSASFEIAGRTLLSSNSDLRPWKMVYHGGKGTSVRKEFLESWLPPFASSNAPAAELLATAVHTENGIPLVKANVYLTSPDTLFKRQTARTFWFGLLIASASLAALVGLASTWRGFAEQLRLNEMQSNFVSSVSHELRSPIAAVRLMAENLERGKVEADRRDEYYRFIGQECRRLSGLIQNVLDFSRIEQGRKQYEFEPTDVRALVESTVALMRTYAEEKHVPLKLGTPTAGGGSSDAFELNIDARAIQQALINLIDNAIKHSRAGSEVLVGLEKTNVQSQASERVSSPLPSPPEEEREQYSQNLGRVVIWVEDNGPGIPLAEQERIFERFYRIGSELRRETEGVGIGLSIVKHVVEAHEGTVSVRSAPGEGSRFTIGLPVSDPKNAKSTNEHE